MSRRVTNNVKMTDKNLAKDAIKLAGCSYREEGNTLVITSGAYANSRVNLTTGEITGDSDYNHSEESLGKIQRNYSEARLNEEIRIKGWQIQSRNVLRNEDVEVVYMTA